MGLFKRIFSLGSKKGKKTRQGVMHPVEPVIQEEHEQEDEEAVATRLLRSSSAHFHKVSPADYGPPPPLPHPIQSVLAAPSISTASLSSVTTRATYTVKVGRRKRHACTEFPNANPPMHEETTTTTPEHENHHKYPPITPRDHTRLQGLRSDPSVASLLNMYDEHGRLDAEAFSNTPPLNTGRAQTRRRGSTLRQLLGNPSSQSSRHMKHDSAGEGDISWAERFLGEHDDESAASSEDIETPVDDLFPPDAKPGPLLKDTSVSTLNDDSLTCAPAISSMEVEVSVITSVSQDMLETPNNLYDIPSPLSPQRASQVFDFLLEDKQDMAFAMERALPPLPLADTLPPSRFSSDTSHDYHVCNNSEILAIPIRTVDDTHLSKGSLPPLPHVYPFMNTSHYYGADLPEPTAINPLVSLDRKRSQSTPAEDVLHDNPTRYPFLATTSQGLRSNGRLHGPRPNKSFIGHAVHTTQPLKDALEDVGADVVAQAGEISSDPFTPLRPRRPHTQTLSSGAASARALVNNDDNEDVSAPSAPNTGTHEAEETIDERLTKTPSNKENKWIANAGYQRPDPKWSSEIGRYNAAKPSLPPIPPVTPLSRSNTLMRNIPLRDNPSPASSSELSPMAKGIMADLRKKRLYARTQGKGEKVMSRLR